ncbi:pyridoxine/pyridoxamine 5'-phosphate oxidase, partial [Mycetocola sp. 2940]
MTRCSLRALVLAGRAFVRVAGPWHPLAIPATTLSARSRHPRGESPHCVAPNAPEHQSWATRPANDRSWQLNPAHDRSWQLDPAIALEWAERAARSSSNGPSGPVDSGNDPLGPITASRIGSPHSVAPNAPEHQNWATRPRARQVVATRSRQRARVGRKGGSILLERPSGPVDSGNDPFGPIDRGYDPLGPITASRIGSPHSVAPTAPEQQNWATRPRARQVVATRSRQRARVGRKGCSIRVERPFRPDRFRQRPFRPDRRHPRGESPHSVAPTAPEQQNWATRPRARQVVATRSRHRARVGRKGGSIRVERPFRPGRFRQRPFRPDRRHPRGESPHSVAPTAPEQQN